MLSGDSGFQQGWPAAAPSPQPPGAEQSRQSREAHPASWYVGLTVLVPTDPLIHLSPESLNFPLISSLLGLGQHYLIFSGGKTESVWSQTLSNLSRLTSDCWLLKLRTKSFDSCFSDSAVSILPRGNRAWFLSAQLQEVHEVTGNITHPQNSVDISEHLPASPSK